MIQNVQQIVRKIRTLIESAVQASEDVRLTIPLNAEKVFFLLPFFTPHIMISPLLEMTWNLY